MSLFGDMDVDEIGDDPFEIAPNTYPAVVTDCKISEKDGNKSFVIKWKLQDPGNEYDGMSVQEYFNMVPEGTEWKDLTGDDKKRQKFFKKRLREAFDLTTEDMREFTPEGAIGLEAMITVKTNKGEGKNEGRSFTNVVSALSMRLYNEQNPAGALASDFDI